MEGRERKCFDHFDLIWLLACQWPLESDNGESSEIEYVVMCEKDEKIWIFTLAFESA